jgi:CO dehydrogenase maturation factor
MKLAITGKGGVGKTTVTSLFVGAYAEDGKNVIAIDANPDANLGIALGFEAKEVSKIIPISDLNDLIAERTGSKPGTYGSLFKLNPKVDDIPNRFSLKKGRVKLLVMGTVKKGNTGCLCPEGALLKSLVSHLVLRSTEVVIMDMDAGMEHIGRGTAKGVDMFIIVVEPGQRSFQTARVIKALSKDFGIEDCFIIGSKTKNDADREFILDNLADFKILGFLNYNDEVLVADKQAKGVYESAPTAVKEILEIKQQLEMIIQQKKGAESGKNYN